MLSKSSWIIFISLLSVKSNLGLKVSFNGSHYIPFLYQAESPSDINISLRLKTIHPSGTLIYGEGKAGESFLLETTHGRLRLVVDLEDQRHEALLGYNLANNRWHSITITQSPGRIILSLDNKKRTRLLTGSSNLLHLQNPIYVGGLDKSLLKTSGAAVHDMTNFIGCLSDVDINSISVLYGATYHTSGNASTAPLKSSCPRHSGLIEFPSRKSYIRLSKSSSPSEFLLRLSFRSNSKSGVIAYRAAKNGHVVISLVEGSLELKIKVANVYPIIITMGKNLNDGEWHDVTSGVTTHECWLSLDNEPGKRLSHRLHLGKFQNHVFIGKGRQTLRLSGFLGCMHNVRVNGSLVASRERYFSSEIVMNSCTLKTFCLPNPCKNGGKCKQQQKDGYTCDCESSLYQGKHCETPVYRATCVEYRYLGLKEDAYCKIDPEASGASTGLIVLCNMTSSHRAVTVIPHDKKDLHKVSDGTNHRGGFYFHNINYGHADPRSIKSLIRESKRCRQYISFHCFNTTILDPQNAFWLSGDRIAQNYWGGAPKGSQRCACAVTSTCANGNVFCNCDVGDAQWREDAGYIIDKEALPVSVLKFSDQASQSMYALGPLECFGFIGKAPKHVTDTSRYLSQACRPVNPRPTSVVPGFPHPNPTVWSLEESTWSNSPPQSPSVSSMVSESATMATSMPITSSSSTELDTVKSNSTLLLPLTSEIPESEIPTGRRNDSKNDAPEGPSKDDIMNDKIKVIISTVVSIFLLMACGVVFVLCRRGARSNTCCANQQSHNDQSVTDKSIGLAVYSGAESESARPVSMEMGTYNVSNGRWLYQTFDQSGNVKKLITFAPMQDEEETSLEQFQSSSLGQ